MHRSCEICGERFPVDKNSTARYCLGCRREIQRARRQAEYELITAPHLHIGKRKCTTCGELFEPKSPARKQCDICRKIQDNKINPHRMKKKNPSKQIETNHEAIVRLSREARIAGMSYGKYVAGMKEGQHE